MRASIHRRVYDTDKATEFCQRFTGSKEDGTDLVETLCRTPRGKWFLHLAGGPNSRCATTEGIFSKPGEEIVPIPDFEAMAFARKNMSGQAFAEIEWEPKPDSFMLNVPMRVDLRTRVKNQARKEHRTMAELVTDALEAYLEHVD